MVTSAISLALTLALGATPPWLEPPFTADPAALVQAAAALAPPEPAGIDLLREEVSVAFDATGRKTWRVRLVFVPRTAAAAEAWSSLSVPYEPTFEARPTVRARTISPGGQVRWLDPTKVVDGVLDQSGARRFSDGRVLQVPLPGVERGAVVEEELEIQETAPFFEAGVALTLRAGRPVPVRSYRVVVSAPAALPLRVQPSGLPAPRLSVEGDRRAFTLEVDDLPPAPELEPLTPPAEARPRQLAVSTGASWGAVADAYAARVERQLAGAGLEATAAAVVGRGDAPAVAAQKVLDWIAGQARYTGLSLGDTGLTPARPAETLARGYGDCKDLSALAVALLRASGRRAHLVVLRSAADELDPGQIGMGAFDHAVARLEADPPVWLDPAGGALAGQLAPSSQGRLALVIRPGTTALGRTPEAPAGENLVLQRRRVEQVDGGWARASEELRYAGQVAVEMRRNFGAMPAADAEKSLRERLNAPEDARVTHAFAPGSGRGEARLEVTASASRWGSSGDDDGEVVVAPQPVFRFLPEPFRTAPLEKGAADRPPPARQRPLRLPFAHRVELRYEVVPAPGFRALPLTAPQGFEVGPARFTAEVAAGAAGAVVVTYRFQADRELQPAEVDRLWREVADRTRVDGPRVKLERTGHALLRQGQGRAALDELRRVAALEPKVAAHRIRLALALLQLRMGDAARAEAARAVALEPENEWALRVQGHVLAHDLLGRPRAVGADLAGAEAALRRARALPASGSRARGLLARVLLQDGRGGRSLAGPRLEEALSELQHLRQDRGDHDFDLDWLAGLLAAGRDAEVLADAAAMPATTRRNGLLAAAAMATGLERFAQELQRLDARDQGAAVQGGLLELLVLRRYQPLAAFAAALRARGALDGAAQGLGDLDRVRRHEAVALDRRAPASMPGLFFKALVGPDPVQAARGLLASSESFEAAEAEEVAASLPAMTGQFAEGMGPDAMVDLLLGLSEVKVEGDGAPWRVTVTMKFGAQASQVLVMEVVQEDGLPRLAGVGSSPPQLARLAVLRARAGDPAGARRLLGWARAALPAPPPGPFTQAGVVAALWPAAGEASDADVARTAAALAAFSQERASQRLDLGLEALRQAATGPARQALTYAAAQASGEAAQVLALAEELAAEGPAAAEAVWWRRGLALQELGRTGEARRLAEARLQAHPGDRAALRALIDLGLRRGEHAGLAGRFAALAALPDVTPAELNDVAWSRLFVEDPVSAAALEEARRAVNGSKTPNASRLHTLACVEAWSGRPPADAMATLLRSVQAAEGRLLPADWLVVGRVAEAYGLPEAAELAYRRVPRGHRLDASPSWGLAVQRLKAMGRPVE